MGVLAPLAVRIVTPASSYTVTNRLLDDLTMKNAAPGGFTACNVQLTAPLDIDHEELSAYQALEVVDTRNGEVCWYGRLEDPGRGSGRIWSLGAVGPSSHATDVKKPVVYNDTRADVWVRYDEKSLPGGTVGGQTDVDPDDPPTLWAMPRGTVVAAGSKVAQRYELLRLTGQHIGLVAVRMTGGKASAGFEQQWVGRGGPAAEANLATKALATAEGSMTAKQGTGFTVGTLHTVPELRFYSVNAGTVGDDLTWNEARGTRVVPTRLDRLGVEVTAAAEYLTYVLPHQIVADVLGRYLPEFDRSTALIDSTSTVQVTQMAYEDGATATQIFEDLMALVPTHWWAAWGNPYGLGAQFSWQPWPSLVALEGLDVRIDDFSATGSAADLYDSVMVRFKDRNGKTKVVTRTQTNPTLARAGLSRQAMIDLGGQIGDIPQATLAGDAFLAAHLTPSNSGTVKVQRPITDLQSGRRLWPWQLRAGVLCRVNGLQPRIDDLNPTPNGATVFRVSDVSYSAKSGEATLTLDSYDRTVARAIAALASRQARNRRI